MITHGGLANYINWCSRAYEVQNGDGSPVHSPLGFDLTVTSLYSPLVSGRTVKLLSETDTIQELKDELVSGRPYSLVKITPAHLEAVGQLIGRRRGAVRVGAFIIGGEALKAESLAAWRELAPDARFINEYGPTETVVGCIVYQSREERAGAVPVGKPIANTQAYVLDEHLHPVPVEVVGELYVGGAGVARGYLNSPAMTAEKFVPDPFGCEPGARLYKTGDLARYRADGNLEYLGRTDEQVKVRGYRIEPGEIESTLTQHPAVRESVVVVLANQTGNRLAAYVVSEPGRAIDIPELKRHVEERLPDYMRPSTYTILQSLPLTPNGKLDRKALPSADLVTSVSAGTEHLSARTATEEILCSVFASLLGVESVSVADDFFQLGGHSLLATQLISRIRELFGVELPLKSVFAGGTVERLAGEVDEAKRASRGVEHKAMGRVERGVEHPASYGQQRVWFFQQMEEGTDLYNIAAAIRIEGELDERRLRGALQRVVDRQEALRTRYEERGGELVQVIEEEVEMRMAVVDLREMSEERGVERARRSRGEWRERR